MLSLSLLAPGHHMFIPPIAGDALKDMEIGVNILLKLALKIKENAPDILVIISPGMPVYHHRFGITHGAHVMRAFESNTTAGEVVELVFPGGDMFATDVCDALFQEKIATEYVTHGSGVVAIDNASLSLLYYLQQTGHTPQVVFISVSDLAPERHALLGKILGHCAQKTNKRVAIAALGSVALLAEDVSSCMQEGIEQGDLAHVLSLPAERYLETGQQFFLPLMIMQGLHGETTIASEDFHFLGAQRYDEGLYPGGFWEKKTA